MGQTTNSYLKARLSAALESIQALEPLLVMDRTNALARLEPVSDTHGMELRRPQTAYSFDDLPPLVSPDTDPLALLWGDHRDGR